MAITITILSEGIEYPLTDFGRLVAHDGWGAVPTKRMSEQGALQHGNTDKGYRMRPRIGKFVLKLNETELSDMYASRKLVMDYLSPEMDLSVKWDIDGVVKQIDCHVGEDVEMNWEVGSWAAQKIVIPFICNDPTFYDPVGDGSVFGIGAGTDTMEIPLEIPLTVGASTIEATNVIHYLGNVLSYPIIRVTGPIHDCVITHNTLGLKLDFTGITVDAAHYYDIDLRYGHKSIIDNHGANRLADLTSDSDLTTFHLGCSPEVAGGLNSITVTGSACTMDTGVAFTWFNRFSGI